MVDRGGSSTAMHHYRVVRLDEMTFAASPELAAMYKLSPFVWREGATFHLLLRVVNVDDDASKKVARIHHGTSTDGLKFRLEEKPVIAPDADEPGSHDSGGCEDPTVARVDGTYYVYYSGWNQNEMRGQLLLASGPDLHHLEKRGIALASNDRTQNPKEATIVQADDGTWCLFFEFADEDKSKIGVASAPRVEGPWKVRDPLFGVREGTWDAWHLSTGPILRVNGQNPVMFYNGATQNAHWRIGWTAFDPAYTAVVARTENPLVLPHIKRQKDDTDIAFAASALEIDGAIHLYYSIADQYCMRAVVQTGSPLESTNT